MIKRPLFSQHVDSVLDVCDGNPFGRLIQRHSQSTSDRHDRSEHLRVSVDPAGGIPVLVTVNQDLIGGLGGHRIGQFERVSRPVSVGKVLQRGAE
jgi:hypothetical protein